MGFYFRDQGSGRAQHLPAVPGTHEKKFLIKIFFYMIPAVARLFHSMHFNVALPNSKSNSNNGTPSHHASSRGQSECSVLFRIARKSHSKNR
jgi:hypothetical protein